MVDELCEKCGGEGTVTSILTEAETTIHVRVLCLDCDGTGKSENWEHG